MESLGNVLNPPTLRTRTRRKLDMMADGKPKRSRVIVLSKGEAQNNDSREGNSHAADGQNSSVDSLKTKSPAVRKCGGCGKVNRLTITVCECGEKMAPLRQCPGCGKPNSIGTRTCACGMSLKELGDDSYKRSLQQTRQRGSRLTRCSLYALTQLHKAAAFARGAGISVLVLSRYNSRKMIYNCHSEGVPQQIAEKFEQLFARAFNKQIPEEALPSALSSVSHNPSSSSHSAVPVLDSSVSSLPVADTLQNTQTRDVPSSSCNAASALLSTQSLQRRVLPPSCPTSPTLGSVSVSSCSALPSGAPLSSQTPPTHSAESVCLATPPKTTPFLPVSSDLYADEYVVEKILQERKMNRRIEYLVKWEGYVNPTWEPEQNLEGNIQLEEFKKVAKPRYSK